MANVQLSTKAVGSVVKIPVNGTATEFIVLHHGNPDTSCYDSSCNGTWLMTKEVYGDQLAPGSSDYKSSALDTYLNQTFYALLSTRAQSNIKAAKLPYWNGTQSNGSLATGANGLSRKVFALSAAEMGCTSTFVFTTEGAKLSYFDSGATSSKRVAYKNSTAVEWSTRSVYNGGGGSTYDNYSIDISSTGGAVGTTVSVKRYVRPAFILPSTILVDDSNNIIFNTDPVITDVTSISGTTQTAACTHKYKVTDADGDPLTVKEYVDGTLTKTRTGITTGTALTFEKTSTAAGFQALSNGSHTLKVTVSDGTATTSKSWTFTKKATSVTITLSSPLTVSGSITVAALTVTGSIPSDATFKVEVTNNAKDTSPVWQDCTTEVLKGVNIVFTNKTAANGAAFNFRVTASRGSSDTSGTITGVSGTFQ